MPHRPGVLGHTSGLTRSLLATLASVPNGNWDLGEQRRKSDPEEHCPGRWRRKDSGDNQNEPSHIEPAAVCDDAKQDPHARRILLTLSTLAEPATGTALRMWRDVRVDDHTFNVLLEAVRGLQLGAVEPSASTGLTPR